MSDAPSSKFSSNIPSVFGGFAPAAEYMTDAAQRAVLFLDVMRQRGNAFREHAAAQAPHVIRSNWSSMAARWIGRSIMPGDVSITLMWSTG